MFFVVIFTFLFVFGLKFSFLSIVYFIGFNHSSKLLFKPLTNKKVKILTKTWFPKYMITQGSSINRYCYLLELWYKLNLYLFFLHLSKYYIRMNFIIRPTLRRKRPSNSKPLFWGICPWPFVTHGEKIIESLPQTLIF